LATVLHYNIAKILFPAWGEVVKRNQGFSLIELLIVVAIILIIAAIAIPNLLRAHTAAKSAVVVIRFMSFHYRRRLALSRLENAGYPRCHSDFRPPSDRDFERCGN